LNELMNYKIKVARIKRYTFILLFIFLIGVFTPYYQVFAGLVIGGAVSLINMLYTARKVDKLGEVAVKIGEDEKPRYASTGMLTRIALSVLVVLVAMQFPEYFNIYSTIIGLFVAQLVTVVDSILEKGKK